MIKASTKQVYFLLLILMIGLVACHSRPTNDSVSIAPIQNDVWLQDFYSALPAGVNNPSLDSILENYEQLIIEREILPRIEGMQFENLFVHSMETNELFLPTYGRASRLPFYLNGFKDLLELQFDKFDSIPEGHPIRGILKSYKKVKEGKALGPKITAGFFLESYSPEMWNHQSYRKIGYLFYFLFTTIDDVGHRQMLDEMLEKYK